MALDFSNTIKALHERAAKAGGEDGDFLLAVAAQLEQAEMLRHQFAFFVLHAKAVVPYDRQPHHFREALERANRVLSAE